MPVVAKQLELLKFRSEHPAFGEGAAVEAAQLNEHTLCLTWRCGDAWASLEADLASMTYAIRHS